MKKTLELAIPTLLIAAVLFAQELPSLGSPYSTVIDVNFGAHQSPGLDGVKVGLAVTGLTANDFWNFYSRDDGEGHWLVDGALPNLKFADGSGSGAGLMVGNAPGCWGNGSSDAMYNTYVYPFNGGNIAIAVTNLAAGQYDFYVYGVDGNYQLTVGPTDYGVKTTLDHPVVNPPVWQEGREYALYRGVSVSAGQGVALTVRPGIYGYAMISGLQIAAAPVVTGTPPSIVTQPQSQTVGVGSTVTFMVAARGAVPLSYQWRLGGTSLVGATGSSLTLANVQPANAGSYSVGVANAFGSTLSSNATLTVVSAATGTLIDVNFGAHQSPGLDGVKVGLAVTGLTANDFWNFYSRDDGEGHWLVDGALPNLKFADGSGSGAGLMVGNAPGCWGNGSSDAMYNTYVYPFNGGNIAIAVTNLAAGQYDFYVYGVDGNYQLTVGPTDYGVKTTLDHPVVNPPVWQEGRQYALYRGVSVGAGQGMALTVRPGIYGYAMISGLQIAAATVVTATPPSIVTQPQSQTAGAGSTVTLTVAATGTAPLSYQWRLGGTDLVGTTGPALVLANVQPANAGSYSVLVSNDAGSIISSNATLTVNLASPCAPPPSGMVSWWRGEGNAVDQVGGNNGVLLNGVGFEAGVVGQTFRFNDSSNSYVEVADSPALRLTNAVTIECWAKRLNTSEVHTLVEKGGAWTGGQTDFEITLNDTYAGGTHFGFGFAGGWRGCAVTPDTAWHHYAAVAVSGEANPVFYIDGVPQTVAYGGGAATIDLFASTSPLHIGALLDPQTGWYYYSSTMIDEPALFNRALSAAEIQAIYNAGSAGKCPPGVAPSIIAQPASQTVPAGATATFTVSAAGTAPLGYQWRLNGTNIAGATSPSLTLSNVQSSQGGKYAVCVTNLFGSASSSDATLTVVQGAPNTLIDVDFGSGPTNSSSSKVGPAAVGQGAKDFWNFYTRDDGSGGWRTFGVLSNLRFANGTASGAELTVLNAPGALANASSDPMYQSYVYPLNGGNAMIGVTNLPVGQYDIYVYGSDATYELAVGGAEYGTRTTFEAPIINPAVWQEGRQYALFRSVSVGVGQAAVLTVRPGESGYAIISGMQIGSASVVTGTPPSIVTQPQSQTVGVGSNVTFTVAASGTSPLGYQWRVGGTNLVGATASALTLANVQPANAGSYSVEVVNGFGSTLSSNAALTVLEAIPSTLINVDFGSGPSNSGSSKVVPAAVGQGARDFWNFYTRDDGSGGWRTFGVLSNLRFANGTASGAELTVLNAPGAWANASSDTMYRSYIYPLNGSDATIGVTNLPAGQYDIYVYGSDATYELAVGGAEYGTRTTFEAPIINPAVWQEGRQYALFRSVSVGVGQAAVLNVRPGQSGYAIISGMQIGSASVVTGTPPSILTQPQSQGVRAGSTATFTVAATGTAPLSYQWRLGGTNLVGATASALTLANVQSVNTGSYSVEVVNAFGSTLSSNATLTVIEAVPNTLINVDFGSGPSNSGSSKVGPAAVGQGTSDFWNFYTRDDGSGGWRTFGVLSDLKFANGAPSGAELTVLNAPGAWANASSDTMYQWYIYPLNGGDATIGVTNLPVGQYDIYVYGSDATYELAVGGAEYGTRTTFEAPIINPAVWQEGRQYALFRSVSVGVGQAAVLAVRPGQSGYAIISGMQIGSASVVTGTPPSIVTQPQSQTVGGGSNVTFMVAATGTAPLIYQWRLGGTNLVGATASALTLANVQPANAGSYSVEVVNGFGSTLSSNATLTVLEAIPNTLINVDFGSGPTNSSSPKVGPAAVGQGTNDSWNFYTRDDGSGGWRTFGVLSNLKFANGASSGAGLTVLNAPGAWANASSDPMYQSYIYPPNGGDATIGVTNLPVGQYDIYVYGSDATYELAVGGADYGTRTTFEAPIINPAVWKEGRQYALFRSVSVGVGQDVTLAARPGVDGYAVLSGMQINSTAVAGNLQTQKAVLKVIRAPSGSASSALQLELRGAPSRVYGIQASVNMMDWMTIGFCATDANGAVKFTDPTAAQYPARLYRVVGQ